MLDKRLVELGFWVNGSTLRGKDIRGCQIRLVTGGCEVETKDTVFIVGGITAIHVQEMEVSGKGNVGIVLK